MTPMRGRHRRAPARRRGAADHRRARTSASDRGAGTPSNLRSSHGCVVRSPHVSRAAPDVASLAFLLGTWRGEGTGSYPTIEPFAYRETLRFDHVGEPGCSYIQESWSPEDEPLHFERGFLRPGAAPGDVELVLAHPIGVTEVAHGRLEEGDLRLRGEELAIGRVGDGPRTSAGLERRYRVDGDALTYEIDMATGATPMTLHLAGSLRRDA